ncbi:nuclear transport factor 2 family protein [uncultured Caulobacter sp.]|uniref:nuclear transport factor 2 family protein n=1 Tax=uncultured Caulobacter sp. TaxID=158749 RepID=UPI002602CE37|nr:nuclear transport factor 2 family protein [uncultured Caulobacter sp.]
MFPLFAALAATSILVPTQPALTAAIAARDTALFDLMFAQCDPAALAATVTDDMEFYHDKGGAMDRQAFIADYAKSCAAKRAPDAWRSRRELVPETLKVYAIPGFGAVEEGTHLFYERKGEGPERLAGKARFSILWKLGADGQWRMARTFSIDHAPAP